MSERFEHWVAAGTLLLAAVLVAALVGMFLGGCGEGDDGCENYGYHVTCSCVDQGTCSTPDGEYDACVSPERFWWAGQEEFVNERDRMDFNGQWRRCRYARLHVDCPCY